MSEFPCFKCGRCCQLVSTAQETKVLDRGDGACRHYDDETKLCLIYENRPDICRVDKQFSLNYAKEYDWETFVDINIKACEYIQREGS
ncbi:YkgJ family cysteine cluster protein [Shewanella yunxiaonensis]|uniref:YkgJ family cysteine cluster protein n=2 Tax=Shewanella yunxiaonensis TaxID=2829809 RepID=A0ABX7YXY7_9GAMM|nr:YkgJ family cysteine cluster protein [Shewanella yunxiaonensis]